MGCSTDGGSILLVERVWFTRWFMLVIPFTFGFHTAIFQLDVELVGLVWMEDLLERVIG
jgi:hypothetical protein